MPKSLGLTQDQMKAHKKELRKYWPCNQAKNRNARQANWRANNPEKVKSYLPKTRKEKDLKNEYQRLLRLAFPEKMKQYSQMPASVESRRRSAKRQYKHNPEKSLSRNKAWRENNKERRAKYQSEYGKKLRQDPAFKVKRNAREKKKYYSDIQTRILCSLRTRLYKKVREAIAKKTASTLDLLGCSIPDFMSHIERQFQEGMTWENYGKGGWVIDHRTPCDSFDLTDSEQQKQCFSFRNLQPLWEADNLRKSNIVILPIQNQPATQLEDFGPEVQIAQAQ